MIDPCLDSVLVMKAIYVVTDIEVDGPVPGKNSMMSLASVAIGEEGNIESEFEAVLDGCSPEYRELRMAKAPTRSLCRRNEGPAATGSSLRIIR